MAPDYYRLPGLFRADGSPADLLDVIRSVDLNYSDGSTISHVFRAGRKPGETEIQAKLNALETLRREIQHLGGEIPLYRAEVADEGGEPARPAGCAS